MEFIKVKAKIGCQGCVYENEDTCPADLTKGGKLNFDFSICSEENESLILVPKL